MWQVGEAVRKTDRVISSKDMLSSQHGSRIAFVAGTYIAGFMAQSRLLLEKGHRVSEVGNETVIEATDSLNPYMDAKGVAHMVDNCSITARLGTRKWGPQFKSRLGERFVLPGGSPLNDSWWEDSFHTDLATCYGFKPSVAIAVAG
ncbi:hypothetical protein N9L18_00645 [Candidatus Pacebacteria bacterium]|nr:hypothetical protein [Candidatus Paceibacterota bacterium]